MLGFGMACSHAAGLFRPPEVWAQHLQRVDAGIIAQFPTAQAEAESLPVAQDLYRRVHAAYAQLRERLTAYRPDVLIMIGDDQGDMFDMSNNPAICVYTGSDPIWGRSPYDWDKPPIERRKVVFENHVELSRVLLKGLIKRGFDVANSEKFVPLGKPDMGVSHMVARVVPEVDATGKLPIICVYINEYFPPLPTAKRCAQLGVAIAEVLADRPERVAVCASGGLSHYPTQSNRGYIDLALDQWILERLVKNDVAALQNLFTFDSDNLRSGTGEIRAWISAAAALNRPATIIDYMPIHSAFTGSGFAYWPQRAA
jgi:Catalytic LigB subunit of aromatic ring-opening dioxygenase